MNEDILKFKNSFEMEEIDNDYSYLIDNLKNYNEEEIKWIINTIFINLNKDNELIILINLELIEKLILQKYPKFIKLFMSSSIFNYLNKLLINPKTENIKNLINLIFIKWKEVLGKDKSGNQTIFYKNYMNLINENKNLIDNKQLSNYLNKLLAYVLINKLKKIDINYKEINELLTFLQQNYQNKEIILIRLIIKTANINSLLDDSIFINSLNIISEENKDLIKKIQLLNKRKISNKNSQNNENISKCKTEILEIKNQIKVLDFQFKNTLKQENYFLDLNYKINRNNLLEPMYNYLKINKNISINNWIDEQLKSQIFLKKILIYSNEFFKVGCEITNNLESLNLNIFKPIITLKIFIKKIKNLNFEEIDIKLFNIKKIKIEKKNKIIDKDTWINYYEIDKKYFGSNFLTIKVNYNNSKWSIPFLINIFKYCYIEKLDENTYKNVDKDNSNNKTEKDTIKLKFSKFKIDNLFLKKFSNLAILFKNDKNSESVSSIIKVFNNSYSVINFEIQINKSIGKNEIDILFKISKIFVMENKNDVVKILNELIYSLII